jgi:heme-degrading monooxygenase HmoA
LKCSNTLVLDSYIIELIHEYQVVEELGKESSVHARVVNLRVRPVDTKEMIRIYRDSVMPAARRQRGFEGAVLLTDPETGIGISITMWETEADREAGEASGYYKEQIGKFADLLTETPVRKHYEVSALEPARELTG